MKYKNNDNLSHPVGVTPIISKIETRYRKITTMLPVPQSRQVLKELMRYEPRSMHGHPPVVWERAEGCRIFDPYGNSWIDFSSAVVLSNAGHSHPKIRKAIIDQVNRKLLHNYCFPSRIRGLLVRRLVEYASLPFLEKVFLLTTGSEAVECAIKLTRMHGRTINPRKIGIVSFTQAFHGRTMGAQMVGGYDEQKSWIGNDDPDIHHLPFPHCFSCPWGVKGYEDCGTVCFERGMNELENKGIDLNHIAGFITESFQGPIVAFLPVDYIAAMRSWASTHQALLIFDEIQAGFGRTGKMFAFEHYGVEVDMICCGKGITSSLPLSAVIGRASILDIPEHGQMSSTHTGNPLCCAAALANLEVLEEEGLIKRAEKVGNMVKHRLDELQQQYPERIGAVSGRGLVFAVLLVEPATKRLDVELARRVTQKALEKGLIMLQTGRGTLKIAPPLSIPEEALNEGIQVIDESIKECIS